MAGPALQDHHIIPSEFSTNDVVKLLTADAGFDINASTNRIYLPASQDLAAQLGTNTTYGTLSPHNGGPVSSYTNAVQNFLDQIQASADFTAAEAGDATALQNVVTQFNNFQNALKIGLINGDLFTNTPGGFTPAETNAINGQFFGTDSNGNISLTTIDSYVAANADQIAAVNALQASLGGNAAKFAGLTADQADTVLAYTKANNINLAAGTPLGSDTTASGSPTAPAELQSYLDAKNINISAPADTADLATTTSVAETEAATNGAAAATGTGVNLTAGEILGAGAVGVTSFASGMQSFVDARAQDQSILSADISAAQTTLTGVAIGAALLVAGPEVALAAAAVLAGAIVIKAVVDSAWPYLAQPIENLGNALSRADLVGAESAAEDVVGAIGKWAATSVSNAISTIAVNEQAFASNPRGYTQQLAQQIWSQTSGALNTFIQNTNSFAHQNVTAVTNLIQQQTTAAIPGQTQLAVQSFGNTAQQIQTNVTSFQRQLVPSSPLVANGTTLNINSNSIVGLSQDSSRNVVIDLTPLLNGQTLTFDDTSNASTSNANSANITVSLGPGSDGLTRSFCITPDASSTQYQIGGSTAFVAGPNSQGSVSGGVVTILNPPAAGISNSCVIGPSNQITNNYQYNGGSSSTTLTTSVDLLSGQINPTAFSLGDATWTTPAAGSGDPSLGSFLTTNTNATGSSLFATQQNQTQSLLDGYGTTVATGNLSGLPMIPADSSLFTQTDSFTLADTSGIASVDQATNLGSYGEGGGDPLDQSGGGGTYVDPTAPIDNGGGGDPGDPNDPNDPLVLSLDGRGINLVSMAQSSTLFDFTGSGVKQQTGWIGADTGFLVYDKNGNGQIDNGTELFGSSFAAGASNGFAALATLDSNGDGVINASDSAYAKLQVWVDSNGDGVTQPGELYSLSQLGISSINLASSANLENVGGNLVTAVGSLTFADGSTEAIDDVTFGSGATPQASQLQGQSAAGFAYLNQVLQALPAQAEGGAAAVATQLGIAAQSVATSETQVGNDMTSGTKVNPNGGFLNLWQINISDEINGSLYTYSVPVSPPVYSASDAVRLALVAEQGTAQSVQAAASDQAQSELDAVTADVEDAQVGSPADQAATTATNITEAAWQQAFTNLVNVSAQLQAPVAQLSNAQTQLNYALLPSKHYFYTTKLDATDLVDAFNDEKASVQALTFGAAALGTLLAAVAKAWNVSTVTLAAAGQTVQAAGGDLIVAASGATSLADGATPSTYVILPGSTATITGFHAGAGGSRLDFLDGSSGTATITQGANGAQITVGSSTVTLAGVAANALSFHDNLAGIGSVAIDVSGAAFSALAPASGTIDDGTSHVTTYALNGNSDSLAVSASQVTVNIAGTSDAVALGTNNIVTVTGGYDALAAGTSGDQITLTGAGYNVAGGGARINLADNSGATVTSTGDTITLGANDTLTVAAGATATITANGTNDQVSASSASVTLAQPNMSVSLVGGGNTLSANGTGEVLGATGGGNTIDAGSRDLVLINGTGGSFDTVNANGDQFGATTGTGQGTGILLGANSQANVYGSNDGVWATAAGISVGIYGGGNGIAASAGDLVAIGNTNGNFDTITANGVMATGTTANGQTPGIVFFGPAQANINGSNDTITLSAGGTANLAGTGDYVTTGLAGGTINLGAGSAATINGPFDTISVGAGATATVTNGAFDYLTGSSGAIIVSGAGTNGLTVNGANDAITDLDGSAVNLVGTGDTLTVAVGATATITVNGTGNRLITSAASVNQLTLTQSGNDLVIGIAGTTAAYTVKNWFSGPSNQFAEISAQDGTSISLIDGAQLDAAQNLLGQGEHDLLVTGGTGNAAILEVNTVGAITGDVALTYNGGGLSFAGDTYLGQGGDFLGLGGQDLFVRNSAGNLAIWEVVTNGAVLAGPLVTSGGSAVVLGASAVLIGIGFNFAGQGGSDLFLRDGSGHLNIWEVGTNGALLTTPAVTVNGSQVVLGSSATLIGTGFNFAGQGGKDLFLRDGSGHLNIWEVGTNGAVLAAPVVTSGGTPVVLGASATLIGTGQDLLGLGGHDFLWQLPTGQVVVWEVNANQQVVATPILNLTNGTPAGIGPGATVIGSSPHLLGLGGHDILWQLPTGQVVVWEVNANQQVVATPILNLTNGTPAGIGPGATVIGSSQNLLGLGGHDILWQLPTGQVVVWEVNANQQVVATPILNLTNGTPAGIGPGATVIGSSQNLLGLGGRDLVWRLADGQVDVWELNTSNQVAGSQVSASSGELDLGQGINDTNVWFDRVNPNGAVSASGTDLRIDIMGTQETMTIGGWFSGGSQSTVGAIKLTGSGLMADAQISSLVQAMSTFETNYASSHGGALFDPTNAANATISDPTVLTAMNQAWHH